MRVRPPSRHSCHCSTLAALPHCSDVRVTARPAAIAQQVQPFCLSRPLTLDTHRILTCLFFLAQDGGRGWGRGGGGGGGGKGKDALRRLRSLHSLHGVVGPTLNSIRRLRGPDKKRTFGVLNFGVSSLSQSFLEACQLQPRLGRSAVVTNIQTDLAAVKGGPEYMGRTKSMLKECPRASGAARGGTVESWV